jgi:DNA-binding MurR/RpiR family transcriptional regulator
MMHRSEEAEFVTIVTKTAILGTSVSQARPPVIGKDRAAAREGRGMATRLVLRIQDRFERLAPSERKLASLLLEREDEILTYSATELAALAGVSKATAARLFRSLGYQDFTEVRLQAREERNRTAPVQRVAMPATPRRRAGTTISGHLEQEVANLVRTFEGLRSDLLTQATKQLAQAPRLWLLGLAAEEGLARHARLLFARLRPEVHLLGGHTGAWAEDLAMAGPSDALLVMALSPRPRLVLPILEHGRTTRLQTIAIVDPTGVATARRLAALPLPCHAASPEPGPSHTAAFSLLRLLATATAARLGMSAVKRLELIRAIHEELEDLET